MQEALDKAKITEEGLSAVAVTIGPGLSLCLRGKYTQNPTFFSRCVSISNFNSVYALIFLFSSCLIFYVALKLHFVA